MTTIHRYELVIRRRESRYLSLEALAERAGMHPALVERYVDCGLIEPSAREGDAVFFDIEAVPRLRTIGRLRDHLGINVAGIAVILDLLERIATLQRENENRRRGR
jgi:DNA-binding transcriptional MerR regulator